MRHAGPVLGSPTDPEAAIITNALVAFLPAASPATGPGAQLPIPNPFGFVGDGIGSLIRGLLRDLVDDFLRNLAEPVLRYVLHTPDLLAEPTLRRLWATSLAALFVMAGLLVGIAGTAMITGSSTRIGGRGGQDRGRERRGAGGRRGGPSVGPPRDHPGDHPWRFRTGGCSTWLTCGFSPCVRGSRHLVGTASRPRPSATPSTRTRRGRQVSQVEQQTATTAEERGREVRENKIKKSKSKDKDKSGGRVKRWRRGFVAAQVVVMVGASNAWAAPGDDGMAQVKSFANNLANYVTAIAASVAVLFIAINGVKYTTAGGSPSRQLEAKNGLVAAGAGLAIALSARVIVGLVVAALQ